MEHTYEVMDRGVDGFQRDTFESSLSLGIEALTYLGYNRYRAHRLAQTFRRHNHKVLYEMHRHHREDVNKYLSETKKHAQELEELFRAEKEDAGYQTESSWDITSRRNEAKELINPAPEESH
jgi:hypothetical protein